MTFTVKSSLYVIIRLYGGNTVFYIFTYTFYSLTRIFLRYLWKTYKRDFSVFGKIVDFEHVGRVLYEESNRRLKNSIFQYEENYRWKFQKIILIRKHFYRGYLQRKMTWRNRQKVFCTFLKIFDRRKKEDEKMRAHEKMTSQNFSHFLRQVFNDFSRK